MTIPGMSRTILALSFALLLGACAAETPVQPASDTTDALADLEADLAATRADL